MDLDEIKYLEKLSGPSLFKIQEIINKTMNLLNNEMSNIKFPYAEGLAGMSLLAINVSSNVINNLIKSVKIPAKDADEYIDKLLETIKSNTKQS